MAEAVVREWTRLLGSSSHDHASSVSTAADGAIYIAGYTLGNLDGQTNSGNDDAFLSKYNGDGSKEWTQLLGSSTWDGKPAYDAAHSVSTAADGSIYIAGWTEGNLDGQRNRGLSSAFLSKYNSDGSRVWTRFPRESSNDLANSVSTAADGSVYVAGYGTNSGKKFAFLSK